jgi:RimJ/RimL family protein N-acetyltransferase
VRIQVALREVVAADLDAFFDHQRDPEATALADFPAPDRSAFDAHWAQILRDESVVVRTVMVDGAVAGNVVSFVADGRREVGYWIGREFWGGGVASRALALFLAEQRERPLFAATSPRNVASQRVLAKAGFVPCGMADGRLLHELRRA